MNRFILLLSAVLLAGPLAFATDITPEEKLGKLIVTMPDLTGVPVSAFDKSYLNVTFRVDKKGSALTLGKENTVAAGNGCLEVAYYNRYVATQCDIEIKEKQLTTVPLAGLELSWDWTALIADLGPQPVFQLKSADKVTTVSFLLNPAKQVDTGKILILPVMTLNLEFTHAHTGVLHTENVVLAPSKVNKFLITPKDVRATLFLDFIHGKMTYPNATSNYMAVAYRSSFPMPGYSSLPYGYMVGAAPGPKQLDSLENFYQLAMDGSGQKLKIYALNPNITQFVYQVIVNEHVVPVKPVAGQSIRVPIATVNVNDYKTNVPGTFKVFTDKSQRVEPLMLPEQDYNIRGVKEKTFNTKTSLFFPIGYNFRFDFYIQDSVGRQTLQDQVYLDLTKE